MIDLTDAVPTPHFAFPPYRAVTYERVHAVENANGFNCLSFKSSPGAKFTSRGHAEAIADEWNRAQVVKP